MSYALHIRRPVELDPVTMEEWLDAVATDPGLELPSGDRIEVICPDGDVLTYQRDGLAIWSSHPRHDLTGFRCLFEYHEGRISVADPDDETVEKMREVAKRLGAEVRGDEGETY